MQKRLSWRWGLLLIILLAGLACAQFARLDHSARQNEARQKFGAVYMTTNNPFYEIIDEEIRTVVENHGDVLISRNPALGADRQIEEIRGLIADGVRVLFINPVDGTQMAEVLQEARAARVIVIAVDTNIAEEGYVAATVVSDNYRAGAQCAEHLIAHAESGRIAVLKHAQARSSQLRIEGFRAVLADQQPVGREDLHRQLGLVVGERGEWRQPAGGHLIGHDAHQRPRHHQRAAQRHGPAQKAQNRVTAWGLLPSPARLARSGAVAGGGVSAGRRSGLGGGWIHREGAGVGAGKRLASMRAGHPSEMRCGERAVKALSGGGEEDCRSSSREIPNPTL